MACTLPVLILAAGQSKRMRGRDKLLELVQGQPLLRRQAQIALAATSGPVLITLPPKPHPRYGVTDDLSVQIVPVPDATEGMNASLRRGLCALPDTASAVMVLLADLPELTTTDLQIVCNAVDLSRDTQIWRGTTEDGAPGHPIVFRKSLFKALKELQGDTGGAEVVSRHRQSLVRVPLPGKRARLDLDTPEEWNAWRAKQGH